MLTGTWAQAKGGKGGGEQTKDTATTGTQSGTPGAGSDLNSRFITAREFRAGKRGGFWRAGTTSMWTDTLIPGEFGGRSGCNRDNQRGVKW